MLEQLGIKVQSVHLKERPELWGNLCCASRSLKLLWTSNQSKSCKNIPSRNLGSAFANLTFKFNQLGALKKICPRSKYAGGSLPKVTAGQQARRSDLWKCTEWGNAMQVRRQWRSLGKEMRWLQWWNHQKRQEATGGAQTINKLTQELKPLESKHWFNYLFILCVAI